MKFRQILPLMKTDKNISLVNMYESPETFVYVMSCEGMLCASGSHDPFTEDDSWIELLDND